MYKILIELQFRDEPTEEEVNQRLKRILDAEVSPDVSTELPPVRRGRGRPRCVCTGK